MELWATQLPQYLVHGLTLGAVYALIALGFSMVYGVLRLLNFAHGEVYMVGAFVGYGVLTLLAPDGALLLPAWATLLAMLLAAMLASGLLGVVIEWFAYRPLRQTSRLAPLLSALGVSFFLHSAVLLVMSARFRTLPTHLLFPPDSGLTVWGVSLSPERLLVLLTTLVLLAALHLLVQRTQLGRAMRAVAVDREAAAMVGIDVNRVVVMTFFLGSALAGAAGVLVGLVFTRVWHLMGFVAGLKGFTAAVLGGIGNLPGAVLGGLVLGLAESLATGYISPTFKDLIAFVALVLVLLLRPTGLLGTRTRQKV
jgi:branched-chain amino acid transport system permease protein